jgi:hypothetical protein
MNGANVRNVNVVTVDDLRNPARKSGFDYVNEHPDESRARRYRARAGANIADVCGPWRATPEESAQDYIDHVLAESPQRRSRRALAEGPTTSTSTSPHRKRRYQPRGARNVPGMSDVYLLVPHSAIGPTGLKPGNSSDVKKRTAGLRTNGLDAWWPEPITCPAEKYAEVEGRFRDYVYDRMEEMGYSPIIVNEAVNFTHGVPLREAQAIAEMLVRQFRAILDAEVLEPYVAA